MLKWTRAWIIKPCRYCGTKLRQDLVKRHESECPKQPLKACSLCGEPVLEHAQERHRVLDCPRAVTCQYCGQQMSRQDFGRHSRSDCARMRLLDRPGSAVMTCQCGATLIAVWERGRLRGHRCPRCNGDGTPRGPEIP